MTVSTNMVARLLASMVPLARTFRKPSASFREQISATRPQMAMLAKTVYRWVS